MGTFTSAMSLTAGDLFVAVGGPTAAPKLTLRRCVSVRRFRTGSADYATVSYTNVAGGGAGEVSMLDGSDRVEILSQIDSPAELEEMLDLLGDGERVTLWSADGGIWG